MYQAAKYSGDFNPHDLEEILGTPGEEDDLSDDMEEENLSGEYSYAITRCRASHFLK